MSVKLTPVADPINLFFFVFSIFAVKIGHFIIIEILLNVMNMHVSLIAKNGKILC